MSMKPKQPLARRAPNAGGDGPAIQVAADGVRLMYRVENPLRNGTFGDIGRFYRVEGNREFWSATVLLPWEEKELGLMDATTLRLFRWDPERRSLALVRDSGVNSQDRYVWGRIDGPGVYGIIGLPGDGDLLTTIRLLSAFDPALLREDRELILKICGLILCRPPEGRGGPGSLCNICLGIEVPELGLPESQLLEVRRLIPILPILPRPPIIATVAGTGAAGFAGDGGPATAAQLQDPVGVAVDQAGNFLIVDENNQRIRRVDAATGIMTTVAGNGMAAFSGDGGPATSASLSFPFGVAFDGARNFFINDLANNRVRRVDAAMGIITTVAGTSVRGFEGDGGAATAASLNGPAGLAVDAAGNLFIADILNERVRRVDATTGIITTVAGMGVAGFAGDGGQATAARLNGPVGLAVDGAGNLFIADQRNQRIRRVDAATGIITTVVGTGVGGFAGDGGPATSAQLNLPRDVEVDSGGNLFVVDIFNQRIRRVDAVTGIIATVAGTGVAGFSGDGGPPTAAQLNQPFSVAVDRAGNILIADQLNHRVRRVFTP